MDTKDTAETTAPLVAPAELAPKPNPAGETEPEDPQHHRELPSSRNASETYKRKIQTPCFVLYKTRGLAAHAEK